MRYIILMTIAVCALLLALAYVLSPRCVPTAQHGPRIGTMILIEGCE